MAKKQFSLVFGANGSIINHNLSKEQRSSFWKRDELEKKAQSFGWMNTDYRQSQINPEIANAIPKEEDFLGYPIRHLSATIVGGGSWKATEFPEDVLKKGTKLLSYKPMFVNHELEVSNIVACTGKAEWTDSFKAPDGTVVPGGIDAMAWVDAKLHPDICRKLSSFPVPHIQSVSVTVIFEWDPSHSFQDSQGNEDEWMFENRIGTEVDGRMVRRVATKIVDFYESSFVWNGADPFAKVKDTDGNLVNIDKSSVVGKAKFDADPLANEYKDNSKYFVTENCIGGEQKIYLSNKLLSNSSNSGKQPNNQKRESMDKKLKSALAAMFGVTEEELSEDHIGQFEVVKKSEFQKMESLATKVGSIEAFDAIGAERDQFKTDLAAAVVKTQELESTIEGNAPLVAFSDATLVKYKEEVMKSYKLSVGDQEEDSAIVALIDRAFDEKDFKTLESQAKQYGAEVVANFDASCSDCGSKNLSYRSSVDTEGRKEENQSGSYVSDSLESMREGNI